MTINSLDKSDADDNLYDIVLSKGEITKLAIILDCALVWARSGELGDFASNLYLLLNKHIERKGDYVIESHHANSKIVIHNGWLDWKETEKARNEP